RDGHPDHGGSGPRDHEAARVATAHAPLRGLSPLTPMRLVLFGPPGAGKGTQAHRLADRFDLALIATGDIFRDNVQNETELGKEAKKYMEGGELVPDDVVVRMVLDRLDEPDAKEGFILDGFPRTLQQAQA